MPTLPTLLTFLAALFLLEITPGPDMMLVLARGVGQGRRVALLTVAGMIFVAGAIQVGLLVLGLASLMQAYPASLAVLQWAGALYLIYLGSRMLWSSRRPAERRQGVRRRVSDWAAVREGCLNNLTNPKSLLFMFAFLPQFIDPAAGPVWSQLLILGAIQKLSGVLSLGSVAVASGTVGHWLTRWPALLVWQERFTGCVMVALGLRLMVTGTASRH
ncbi:LysE family translocator [Pleomorphomonas carboxyditropha]|uniref:Lysine transporter LysE n=1 Tax=Pleomorphomonas carboxyditropha TaxID=2023338 RepID=A0A2G9WRV9_9HYPH|nr:LysE family translocator [Pleomorphomonas carboxyditropha]PIO97457.1 lysine transporter LysE [Pleomorphomonas carboxyditropha]